MPLGQNLTLLATTIGADVKELKKNSSIKETNPVFTYNLDQTVSRIDYQSGNYKLFTYLNGNLSQLDYVVGPTTIRKTFNYNVNGTLASMVETII